MATEQHFNNAEGFVTAKWVGSKGDTIEIEGRHNTTTYSSADAVALAYAGDSSMVPDRIVFLHGTDTLCRLGSPTRATTWEDIERACVESDGSLSYDETMFSFAPTVDSSSDKFYEFNRVTFHGRTQNIPDGNRIYMACLTGNKRNGDGKVLLAIVDLANEGVYRQKPHDFELSIDWAVKFK